LYKSTACFPRADELIRVDSYRSHPLQMQNNVNKGSIGSVPQKREKLSLNISLFNV
jgi:hypothetical protein